MGDFKIHISVSIQIKNLHLKKQMIRYIFTAIVFLTILLAGNQGVDGRSIHKSRSRYNSFQKYHKIERKIRAYSRPRKYSTNDIQRNIAKMLIQRRNFANKLFF